MAKRVVFLADSISTQKAGIHYYGRQLIHAIMTSYPEHEYISISSAEIPNPISEQIIVPISTAIPFHLRWRQLLSIPRKVKALDPDVVIELAHFGPFNLPNSIKRMTVIHDLSAITHPQFHSLGSHIVQRVSLSRILNRTDVVISNSLFTKQEIIKKYRLPDSKIQVIYPSIQVDAAYTSNQLDKPFQDESYFLCVGTIEPRKNYELVIKAFEKVYKTNPNMHLVIVGMYGWKHASFDSLYKHSKAKDNIHVTGYVSESQLDKIYRGALAFISASHFEGFGMPILEAAKRELPLIVADNSSQKEIVGKRGLLFSSESVEQLTNHMISLINSQFVRDALRIKSKEIVIGIEEQRKLQLQALQL